ncbi:alpha/beta fold hydrolase [Kitasatospora sp. NPDC057015]|uniref:alpha/beta fold hydrolase n=1 Tax=Kitasatospora sp. NPDC057015 TaxID=3346001 RepID=UPI00363C4D7E
MAVIRANGVALYYEVRGAGPGLVLVHGSWGDADCWERVAPGLAERCTVVSYNRRGHSRSEEVLTQGSVHEDAADLAALIEGLGLAPAFVCGTLYGSMVALRLAAARPGLLRGLAAHEPPAVGLLAADPDQRPLADAALDRVAPVRALLERGETAAAAELFVETVTFGPGAWARLPAPLRHTYIRNAPTFLDELRDPDAFDLDLAALGNFGEAALLTQGDDGDPVSTAVLDIIDLALPKAERHLYEGAGREPHVVRPAEFVGQTLPYALR